MCGIAGVVRTDGIEQVAQLGTCLAEALRHRGPDGEGFLVAGGDTSPVVIGRGRLGAFPGASLLLVHRRLSIVDLETGEQPMSNESGAIWIVFNGEVFNHIALRRELERAGHRFRSRADTEAIVHGYEQWGLGVFDRLNGQFAVALVDWPRRRLVLARDPFGVKPLYYGSYNGHLWFASEVKAAIAAGLVAPRMNDAALSLYLHYRFVPAPATLFDGVEKLPPGHLVVADFGRGGSHSGPTAFVGDAPSEERGLSRREWVERLAGATERSVAAQLMADVPVGAQLSGGLDSSIVVACMRKAGAPLRTYAVGFPGLQYGDELAEARIAARALGSRHRERALTAEQYLARWPEVVRNLEEPLANPGTLLSQVVCELAREDLKVVLSGQGADEPLGGYPRHVALRLARLIGRFGASHWLALAGPFAGRGERLPRFRRVLEQAGELEQFVELFAVVPLKEQGALIAGRSGYKPDWNAIAAPVRYWLARAEALDPVNRFLYLDVRLSLADDLLLVADKLAMITSVEVRVPYLDREVMAVAERMPSRFKVALWGGRKRLQRGVGRGLLAQPLVDRLTGWGAGFRRKLGFATPFDDWFRSALAGRLEVLLTGPDASLPAFLRGDEVRAFVRRHVAGQQDHRRQLLAFLALEFWHRRFIRNNPVALIEHGEGM